MYKSPSKNIKSMGVTQLYPLKVSLFWDAVYVCKGILILFIILIASILLSVVNMWITSAMLRGGGNPAWYCIQFLLVGINRVNRRQRVLAVSVSVERLLAGRRHAWPRTLRCRVCVTRWLNHRSHSHHRRRRCCCSKLCIRVIVVLTSFRLCYCHHDMCPAPSSLRLRAPRDVSLTSRSQPAQWRFNRGIFCASDST